ncbi:uncharacterized protein LOC126704941 [Quercus robur]|uniref:uncharacterized protein LOC126704941 n=1 Tax=Quercus robur TaxID=38942 RepID=UPI0021616634|nr:uncharacterized protein LOC126704941 [Quercus robur]
MTNDHDFSMHLANQIYFVLLMPKFQKHLTMSDMATLAIKVSVALQSASSKDDHRCKKACILVLVLVDYLKLVPGSVRKLQRFTSRRAKMAVCSFRHRLSTIYEGTTL